MRTTRNVSAQQVPTDPVEELRLALKIPIRDSQRKEELEFRRNQVAKAIEGLRTISDLRRLSESRQFRRAREPATTPT